jgi:hypothetical protein
MNVGWNFVSWPINDSINKDVITVNVAGVNYTWADAVSAGYVVGFVYGWNAPSQNYMLSDAFASDHGYWVYAYHSCVLWTSSSITSDEQYIASLSTSWNIVGLPFDQSVEKTNIIVCYGGVNYSWADAVAGGIVISTIYGWNGLGQNYELAESMHPGQAYWIYTYHTCILKKGG